MGPASVVTRARQCPAARTKRNEAMSHTMIIRARNVDEVTYVVDIDLRAVQVQNYNTPTI